MRTLALVLTIIGALNWGLIALFGFDVVQAILGGTTNYEPGIISRIVFGLVGLSGFYLLFNIGMLTRVKEE